MELMNVYFEKIFNGWSQPRMKLLPDAIYTERNEGLIA